MEKVLITEERPLRSLPSGEVDLVQAVDVIIEHFGPRAVTIVSQGRQSSEIASSGMHLSANDGYVAVGDAARKMARVAIRRYHQSSLQRLGVPFAEALDRLFPDGAAYLSRCIRSVVSDVGRVARRELPTISLEQSIANADGEDSIPLVDTLADVSVDSDPLSSLLQKEARGDLREALRRALKRLPVNYRSVLHRDMERERVRRRGEAIPAESDRERQSVYRARATLARLIIQECGPDNPYLQMLKPPANPTLRVRRHDSIAVPRDQWSPQRQSELFQLILSQPWTLRMTENGDVPEAIVHDVTPGHNATPPSPELRKAMRVIDLYTIDYVHPKGEAAQQLYNQGRALRKEGRLEEAIAAYRTCYETELSFVAAYNEVGVLLSQMGRLRDALRVYHHIIERYPMREDYYIAATNAADIYLTWFEAGRNLDENIQHAINFAELAMQRPTPMRAANLILAYVKDRYYLRARQVLADGMSGIWPNCPPEKALHTLSQIRDQDLIHWWVWLDEQLHEERQNENH